MHFPIGCLATCNIQVLQHSYCLQWLRYENSQESSQWLDICIPAFLKTFLDPIMKSLTSQRNKFSKLTYMNLQQFSKHDLNRMTSYNASTALAVFIVIVIFGFSLLCFYSFSLAKYKRTVSCSVMAIRDHDGYCTDFFHMTNILLKTGNSL